MSIAPVSAEDLLTLRQVDGMSGRGCSLVLLQGDVSDIMLVAEASHEVHGMGIKSRPVCLTEFDQCYLNS